MQRQRTHGWVGVTCAALLVLGLGGRAAGQADRICFEAESAIEIEAPMRLVRQDAPPAAGEVVPGASGGAYLEIPAGSGNPPEVNAGKAVYEIDIPQDGYYHLWARVYWEDECSNSFSLQIDDGPRFAFGQTMTFKTWHWVRSPPRLGVMNLTRGRHRLTVHNREDGVRIDQILLTLNRRLIPVDIEPVSGSVATR